MAGTYHRPGDLASVPLFPLPNVVLFPCAVLPLHIFEQRYREMTADALAGRKQIAMTLLKPGWEKEYDQRPQIEPIVCVGTILAHQKLPDGKYNFLLKGQTRARIVREHGDKSYRLAELHPLEQVPAHEQELLPARRELTEIFDRGTLLATDIGRQFRQLLTTSIPTADIADLIAFHFVDDICLKQSLLGEASVRERVYRTVEAFGRVRPPLEPATGPQWGQKNPNLN